LWCPTKDDVEGAFAIEKMNDARVLARDIALLAGSLGNLVQMHVMSRVMTQNLERFLFALSIARSHPEEQTAVFQMLSEMPGVLMADESRPCRPDQAGGAVCNRRRPEDAEQRTAGSRHREAAEHDRHLDAGADDGALGIADGLIGDIADARSLGIVLELGG
jgi:hypothetical protein